MDSELLVDMTEVAILGRLLDSENADLPPEAARYILALEFRPADREHMNELATKARAGTLSAQEEIVLENYRHVGRLLALMQSKARLSLKKVAA